MYHDVAEAGNYLVEDIEVGESDAFSPVTSKCTRAVNLPDPPTFSAFHTSLRLMQAVLSFGQRRLLLHRSRVPQIHTRYASLTGAISRGVREAQRSAESKRGTYDDLNITDTRRRRLTPRSEDNEQAEWWKKSQNDRPEWRPSRNADYLIEAPRTIPYTAADSEFLYGTHSVEAAIKAKRRKLHRLYIYAAEDGGARSEAEQSLYKLATQSGVNIIRVGGPEWKQKLSQLSAGRAHNGFVLEASPIPIPLITACEEVEYAGAIWQARTEDGIQKVGAKTQERFPLLLLLDGVTDPGNVGAVLRSAYFFGVDGVLSTEYGSSSSASVILKASAGAAEFLPVFRIRNEVDFVQSCQDNGWHVSTATAPDAATAIKSARRHRPAATKHTPADILASKPTVLILGNEGEGVRPKLSRLSDSFISIPDAPGAHAGVDSLNVSVAAAILMRDLVSPFFVSGSSKRVAKEDRAGHSNKPPKGEDIF